MCGRRFVPSLWHVSFRHHLNYNPYGDYLLSVGIEQVGWVVWRTLLLIRYFTNRLKLTYLSVRPRIDFEGIYHSRTCCRAIHGYMVRLETVKVRRLVRYNNPTMWKTSARATRRLSPFERHLNAHWCAVGQQTENELRRFRSFTTGFDNIPPLRPKAAMFPARTS